MQQKPSQSDGQAIEKLSKAFLQFRYFYHYQKRACREGPGGCPGIRPGDIMMLFSIWALQRKQGHTVTATDLSRSMGIKTPSVNVVLASLEKAGMITRTIDAEDRRFMRIELSIQGENCVKHWHSHYAEHMRGLVAYLGIEKSDCLAELMNDIYCYLRTTEQEEKAKKSQL